MNLRSKSFSFAVTSALALVAAACSSSGGSTNNNNTDAGNNNPPPARDAGNGNDGGDMTDDSGDQPQSIEYDAVLSGAEVVPAVQTTSMGMAKFVLQPDNVTLTYDITTDVQNATGAALHIGAPGETGAVAYDLGAVSGHMTGTVTITSDDADKLAADMFYVELVSGANAVVRGQLTLPGAEIFVATLSGDQEVPPTVTTTHAHASFVLNDGKDTVRYHFSTDATPTDVNVHRAIGSLTGPVAFPFGSTDQTLDGTFSLAGNDAADLEAGRFYVEVNTAKFATGELRGQIIKPGETLFTAVLSGKDEVPATNSTATGGAQFISSPGHDALRYEAVVNGIIPTAAEVDNAAAGMNGPTVWQLMLSASGAVGSVTMTPQQVPALMSGNFYVNVKTASYPNGELRGQLTQR